jgi:hypothetical protein
MFERTALCIRNPGMPDFSQPATKLSNKGETQYVNVLEIPPVVSPVTAVRASIVSDAKKGKL